VTVWTVGHSTRTLEQFIRVLRAHGIESVADIRRFPGSRRMPHFTAPALAQALERQGVAYTWIAGLGGRRRPDPGSPNRAWRHPAFRAYADHLASEPFAEGLFELQLVAQGLRTAMMCSEALWWRCHRRLVADALVTLGFEVAHIGDENRVEAHRLAAPARLVRGELTYVPARRAAQ
jgi:uncharacterized protein (DUF488 family)